MAGRVDRAAVLLAALDTEGANDAGGLSEVGRGFLAAGASTEAAASFDLALDIDPECAEARYRRGLARLALGQEDGARDDFEAVAALRPEGELAARARRAVEALAPERGGMSAMEKPGVRIERAGELAILRLDKARGNALDEPMVEALIAAVAEVAADAASRGVLLASAHPKLFCPGLDLVALVEYDRAAMERFFARFEESVLALYALRKPVVAAVAGAAVAGGCILALTADHRISRQGSVIGLNEVRVGVPLPWWVLTLLRTSISPAALTRVALLGENFTDDEARRIGLVHEVLPAEGFEKAALARLDELARRDPAALGTTKAWLREGALEEMRASGPERRATFLDAWFSPAAQREDPRDGGLAHAKGMSPGPGRRPERPRGMWKRISGSPRGGPPPPLPRDPPPDALPTRRRSGGARARGLRGGAPGPLRGGRAPPWLVGLRRHERGRVTPGQPARGRARRHSQATATTRGHGGRATQGAVGVRHERLHRFPVLGNLVADDGEDRVPDRGGQRRGRERPHGPEPRDSGERRHRGPDPGEEAAQEDPGRAPPPVGLFERRPSPRPA